MESIVRNVYNWGRFALIVNTMPNPEPVVYHKSTQGNPSITFTAKNTGGICAYKYIANGLISMSYAMSKLEELNTEVQELKNVDL